MINKKGISTLFYLYNIIIAAGLRGRQIFFLSLQRLLLAAAIGMALVSAVIIPFYIIAH